MCSTAPIYLYYYIARSFLAVRSASGYSKILDRESRVESKMCKSDSTWIIISVGSNPNITNFEQLQTWQVELQTHSNPGSSTKTELGTLLSHSKKQARNFEHVKPEIWAEPRPKYRKTEIRTLLSPGSFIQHLPKSNLNPPKIPNFKPMNWGFNDSIQH